MYSYFCISIIIQICILTRILKMLFWCMFSQEVDNCVYHIFKSKQRPQSGERSVNDDTFSLIHWESRLNSCFTFDELQNGGLKPLAN